MHRLLGEGLAERGVDFGDVDDESGGGVWRCGEGDPESCGHMPGSQGGGRIDRELVGGSGDDEVDGSCQIYLVGGSHL